MHWKEQHQFITIFSLVCAHVEKAHIYNQFVNYMQLKTYNLKTAYLDVSVFARCSRKDIRDGTSGHV